MLVKFRESQLISQDIAVAAEKNYYFVVIFNWYNDLTVKISDRLIDTKIEQIYIGS